MSNRTIKARPLTAGEFAPFGDVIEVASTPDQMINQGKCGRYHDLAVLDIVGGRTGISLFDAEARAFPYTLDLMERHPWGSQAFIPMTGVPFLVTVASDEGGQPANIRAFLTGPGQGINLHRSVWHGVLAPVGSQGLYAVVDRICDTPNLEEHWFDAPFIIEAPA